MEYVTSFCCFILHINTVKEWVHQMEGRNWTWFQMFILYTYSNTKPNKIKCENRKKQNIGFSKFYHEEPDCIQSKSVTSLKQTKEKGMDRNDSHIICIYCMQQSPTNFRIRLDWVNVLWFSGSFSFLKHWELCVFHKCIGKTRFLFTRGHQENVDSQCPVCSVKVVSLQLYD